MELKPTPFSTPSPDAAYRVTAIVSAYNSERFLRGCLEDLVAQTLFQKGALEIVVIDAGSTEDEHSIVAEFQRQHDHVVYVRTPRREKIYTCWNRGIRLARAPYLTNANTDDRHRPDALELMADHLDAHPDTALVYADSLITSTPNDTFEGTRAALRTAWPAHDYGELERRCYVGPHPMWRRDVHQRHGLFHEQFVSAGDYEFWLRIGKTEPFDRIPEVLGLYYDNPKGVERSYGHNGPETAAIHRAYGIRPDGRGVSSARAAVAPEELHELQRRSAENVRRLLGGTERPETLVELVEQFHALSARQAWEAAERLTEQGVARFEEESYAWVLRAKALRLCRRFPEAIDAVHHALRLEEGPEALLEVVEIARGSQDYAEAEQVEAYLRQRYPQWTSQWQQQTARAS